MDNEKITFSEVFKEAWRLTKENLGFLMGYQAILFFLSVLLGMRQQGSSGTVLILVVLWVLVLLAKLGFYHSAIMINRGIKPGFDQLYRNWKQLGTWIVSALLFGIMLGIGFALLILPGLWVLARFGLFTFFIVDKNTGPIDALKGSYEASRGYGWTLLWILLAGALLEIVGFMLFIVGSFITVPIATLALAEAYRKLTTPDTEIIT
jgi:uncharacterized membrane protein